MTEQEAKDWLKVLSGTLNNTDKRVEALDMGIKALEEVEKLRKENVALKNRCYAMTHGSLCFFCPIDCSDRTVKFRRNEDAE